MLLCILHLYYKEQLPEMLRLLDNITLPFDLCVTICENDGEIIRMIKDRHPNAKIIKTESRGFDIYPFLVALDAMDIEKYDFVIKLHTKGDYPYHYYLYPYCMFGAKWRKALTSFISSKKHFKRCMAAFAQDKELGMQSDFRLIINYSHVEPAQRAYEMLSGLFPKLPEKGPLNFVAGTMFIARTEALMGLAQLDLHKEDFPDHRKMKGCHCGTMAHSLERFIGFYACAAGFKIADKFHSRAERFFINLRAWLHYKIIRPVFIRKKALVLR